MSYLSLVISLLALAVAGASALYSPSQAVTQGRATAIESDRRHDELTPLFEAGCEVSGDLEDTAVLKIALTGGNLFFAGMWGQFSDQIRLGPIHARRTARAATRHRAHRGNEQKPAEATKLDRRLPARAGQQCLQALGVQYRVAVMSAAIGLRPSRAWISWSRTWSALVMSMCGAA